MSLPSAREKRPRLVCFPFPYRCSRVFCEVTARVFSWFVRPSISGSYAFTVFLAHFGQFLLRQRFIRRPPATAVPPDTSISA